MKRRLLLISVLFLGLSFAQHDTYTSDLDIIVPNGSFMFNYCGTKTSICPLGGPDRDRYSGMKGAFTSLEPVAIEFGRNIFEIKMSDGSFLYYSTGEDTPFTKGGPIKLSEHEKRLSRIGSNIITDSSIIIDDIFLDESGIGYKYKLSTGNEIWGDTFANLEKILPRVPRDKEVEFVKMINDLDIKYDDMEDVFFISINSVSLGGISSLPIQPYLVFKDSKPLLRVKYYYNGNNWLFVDRMLIKVDDQRVDIDDLVFKRDNSAHSVWEWHDKIASSEDIKLLNDIALSKDVKVRFYGKQSYSDNEISSKQRKFMSNIMKVYKMFN